MQKPTYDQIMTTRAFAPWLEDLETKVWSDLEENLGRPPTEEEFERHYDEALTRFDSFLKNVEPQWISH